MQVGILGKPHPTNVSHALRLTYVSQTLRLTCVSQTTLGMLMGPLAPRSLGGGMHVPTATNKLHQGLLAFQSRAIIVSHCLNPFLLSTSYTWM